MKRVHVLWNQTFQTCNLYSRHELIYYKDFLLEIIWNHECSIKSYFILLHSSTAYSHIIHQTYTKVRRPPLPDYQSATQMAQLARQKHYWQMDRSHSHEGVVGYCNGQAPYYQVSDDGRLPLSPLRLNFPRIVDEVCRPGINKRIVLGSRVWNASVSVRSFEVLFEIIC